jgi:predicted nucleic acid-binding protein
VRRCERHGGVDVSGKYAGPETVNGNYVPEISGAAPVLHWRSARRHEFEVPTAVLVEACHLMRRDDERGRLQDVLPTFGMRPVQVADDEQFRSDVFAWMRRYVDRTPDYADASLCILAHRGSAAGVWTYDSEFRTVWRLPSGKPVPVAIRRA